MEFMVGTIIKKKKEREREERNIKKKITLFLKFGTISLVWYLSYKTIPKVSILRNTIEFY